MSAVQKPPLKSPEMTPRRRPSLQFSRQRRRLLVLLGATALLYGLGLGRLDFWAPDEPRYGAIAEELRSFRHGASGLALLHLNDVPYTQKPPLYFWLAAAIGSVGNRVDELSARLPSAIAGILCVGLTAWIGQLLFRRSTPAFLAAGLLATSFRFAFSARRAQLDVLLSLFEVAAIACFLFLESRRGGIENARRSPLVILALHASLGAAALTKGPVGWIPLLIFAAYLSWEGRLSAFRAISPTWAWCISLGPVALWILASVALAPPGFAHVAITENLYSRFFLGSSHARPFYYFLIQLPLDFLPWSLLLPFAIPPLWRLTKSPQSQAESKGETEIKRNWDARAAARFLLVWLIVPFLFFSLSAGKRGLYLLPIFPAFALACVLVGRDAQHLAALTPSAIRRFSVALGLVWAIEVVAFNIALPQLDSEKSPRPIAEAAARESQPNEKIGVYGMSPLEGAITYYGGRPVASLDDESQLASFLAQGGRFVILRARHLDALGPRLNLRELQSFRSDRRRISLAKQITPTPQRENP